MSSVTGLAGSSHFGTHNASKSVLEAASEALAVELAKFNAQVLIIVLGYFPINFLRAVSQTSEKRSAVYTDPSQDYRAADRIAAVHIADKQCGDKDKAALRIYESVSIDPNCPVQTQRQKMQWARVQLEPDFVKWLWAKFDLMKENIELMKPISMSTERDLEQLEAFAKTL